jgi:transketolase
MTKSVATTIRRSVLEQSRRVNIGHVGSSLSIVEIVAVLAERILRLDDGDDRDRFVLSKGHAALAWYCALHATGRLTDDELGTFCGDGTLLGGHPEHELSGVDFSTGSLGQGLSLAAGGALAGRWQHSERRVFALLSDAECNEGSTWEAAMFAAHHRLANLVAIIDVNGQQALGYTKDVLDLAPLADRWRAFGWDVREVPGHDTDAIEATIAALDTKDGAPHVLLADTTFGRGVDFMESRIEWHYLPMSADQFASALEQVDPA